MSEPTALAGDLDADLRSYFALTTSTQLPRRVTEMSAARLRARRSPVTALLATAAGVVAIAALVFVVATHTGRPNATSGALSAGSGAGGSRNAPALTAPKSVGPITYPGVDTARLAASGVLLLSPDGHGTALLSAGQAQAAAEGSVGATAYTPGPAVLAFAELTSQSPPSTCLCWAVDVPVTAASGTAAAATTSSTELVLVDAVTGRIAAALSGHGIP
jgi:hypothetical protein